MIQLQSDEAIQQVYRRHWFAFGVAIAQVGAALLASAFLPFFLSLVIPEFASAYSGWLYAGAALLAEVLWIILFFVIADYYLDAWVITNKRVVFIELKGLFSRVTSSVRLGDIQDISVTTKGIIPTLLKFGDVRVQSAGTHGEFIFRQIPRPDDVKDVMMRMRATYEANEGSLSTAVQEKGA